MWFRNLIIYQLPAGWEITAEQLDAQLARHAFTPSASADEHSSGWAPPRDDDERLVYAVDRQWLLTLRQERKLLPARVIAQFLKQRVEEVEAQEGFRPGRKRMKALKDEVRDALLPRAFSLTSDTRAWIDPVNGWLAIDATSAGRADEMISMMVRSIDGFPARALSVVDAPATAMTDWLLSGEPPAGFTVDQDAELRAREGKATIRYANQSLEREDIVRHTEAGKQCTRLALTWSNRISFLLNDRLEFKRLRPLDLIQEQAGTADINAAERFASDFLLMSGELARLLEDVVAALGGIRPAPVVASASPAANPAPGAAFDGPPF